MNKDLILSAIRKAVRDERLNAWHLAIFHALVELCLQSECIGGFCISRMKVMKLARIKAAPTYHKYILELNNMGYIQYTPSYHPKNGSSVKMLY